MSLNNNIFRGSGKVQHDKHVRPVNNDPVKSRENQIKSEFTKQSSLPTGKCPPGTRWHKKLMQCIDSSNIELLKSKKGSGMGDMTDHQEAQRSTIREALINYGKTDRI